MTSGFGRIERRLLEELTTLARQGSPGASTSFLAERVFGETPTVTQRASVARAVRSLRRKGRVVIRPASAFHRRRWVRLVDVEE
jgi:hypothetical protein